jgi:hypothetical protein
MKNGSKILTLGTTLLLATSLTFVSSPVWSSVLTLPVPLVWQHKDTNMNCVAQPPAPPVNAPHAVNHAPGCRHCGYYCAPASISMYAQYRGRVGIQIQQDDIYDQGKFLHGEIPANGITETTGIGMFDVPVIMGGPGGEVQTAFAFAVGTPYQWGLVPMGGNPMTHGLVIACIDDNIPLLWCDHYNWPEGMDPPPDPANDELTGHCKVIAGYDDKCTADYNDDEYYIYDPWPLSSSPYWQAANTVISPLDVYLADFDPTPNTTSSWGGVKNLYR